MIKQVEGFDKYVAFIGFRNVRLRDVDHFLKLIRKKQDKVVTQFFNASLVAGRKHLFFATLNALKAFRNGTNISKNLAIECLLYASAQRQIRMAFELLGIKQGLSQIAVLILADSESSVKDSSIEVTNLVEGIRDDRVLDFSDEKTSAVRKLFGISDVELGSRDRNDDEKRAISDLVIEHMAILVTQR
ncbi:hypothetical protein E3J51_05435 [Candidatus Bathyarchaeota archaeon]|nr:MAG: hypothetical protein E3J51_05435 [Candidatus Bathyarchaeota archaeon]